MLVDWDDFKSSVLKVDRGLSFEDASDVFRNGYVVRQRNDDPEQYAAIGFAKGRLITLIFEYRTSDIGDFIWLVTYWKATKSEARIYEQS